MSWLATDLIASKQSPKNHSDKKKKTQLFNVIHGVILYI